MRFYLVLCSLFINNQLNFLLEQLELPIMRPFISTVQCEAAFCALQFQATLIVSQSATAYAQYRSYSGDYQSLWTIAVQELLLLLKRTAFLLRFQS
jgi:hypothetical protein